MITPSQVANTLNTIDFVAAEVVDDSAIIVWVRSDPYRHPSSIEINLDAFGEVGLDIACNAIDAILDASAGEIDRARRKLHDARRELLDMAAE